MCAESFYHAVASPYHPVVRIHAIGKARDAADCGCLRHVTSAASAGGANVRLYTAVCRTM